MLFNNSESKVMSNDLKNIMMYYHTSLRNVGLYSTLSITLFTFSLFFRKQDNLIASSILHVISLLSLIISVFISYFLLLDMKYFIHKNKKFYNDNHAIIDKWYTLSTYIFYFIIVLIFIFLYVLFNDVKHLIIKYKIF